MGSSNLQQYLSIYHSRSISDLLFSRVLQEFGSLCQLVAVADKQLMKMGFEESQIQALRGEKAEADIEKLIARDTCWAETSGNTILTYESNEYPTLLKEISCPPPVLYISGNAKLLCTPQIAIVGSRKSSAYGRRNGYWMAHELSNAGITISSGMARGIDSQAHRGALDAGGGTIAVIGTGADRLYPACNKGLAEEIKQQGAIVSEFALGTAPYPYNFPRRNRIIAGLSLGTLVIEAAEKSGSLVSSRIAMEQNREVFAIPGPISSQNSRGCHQLLREGAKLVECPEDVLEELKLDLRIKQSTDDKNGEAGEQLSPDCARSPGETSVKEHRILRAIDNQGCLPETLSDELGIEIQELIAQLLDLEIQGRIMVEGGRYFCVN